MKKINIAFALLISTLILQNTNAQTIKKQKPLVIEMQGSFAVGGTMISEPGTFDINS